MLKRMTFKGNLKEIETKLHGLLWNYLFLRRGGFVLYRPHNVGARPPCPCLSGRYPLCENFPAGLPPFMCFFLQKDVS